MLHRSGIYVHIFYKVPMKIRQISSQSRFQFFFILLPCYPTESTYNKCTVNSVCYSLYFFLYLQYCMILTNSCWNSSIFQGFRHAVCPNPVYLSSKFSAIESGFEIFFAFFSLFHEKKDLNDKLSSFENVVSFAYEIEES